MLGCRFTYRVTDPGVSRRKGVMAKILIEEIKADR
jgi:hypothetical protein